MRGKKIIQKSEKRYTEREETMGKAYYSFNFSQGLKMLQKLGEEDRVGRTEKCTMNNVHEIVSQPLI